MRVYLKILLIITAMIVMTGVATALHTHELKLLDVKYNQLTKEAKSQVDCLAENIYHEAGYEPEEGKIAVAMVTLNRLNDPRYPKDICSVVKQKTHSTCQFSWFCMPVHLNKENKVYEQAMDVALHVYVNYEKMTDVTLGALYYHADYVNPRWKLIKTTTIGRHIFYKEGVKFNDDKTKSAVERRKQLEALVLPTDGGDNT
jgi:spore germination cell wall hydrolase CwlJ-like protein